MNLPRAFPPLVPLALALALAACEGRVPENIGQEASGEDPSINTADFQVRTDGEAWFVATDGRFRRYSFEEDARVGELGTLFADRGLSPGSLGNDGKPFALDDRYLYGFSQLRGSAFRLTKDGSRGPEALPFTDVEPRIRPSALAVGSGHIFVGAGIGDSGEVWEVDQNGKAGQRIAGYGVVFPVPSAIWADDRRVTWVDARHWVRAIDLVDGSGAGQPTRDLLYFSERVSLYAMGKDALYAVHGALAFPRPPSVGGARGKRRRESAHDRDRAHPSRRFPARGGGGSPPEEAVRARGGRLSARDADTRRGRRLRDRSAPPLRRRGLDRGASRDRAVPHRNDPRRAHADARDLARHLPQALLLGPTPGPMRAGGNA